MSDYVVTVPKGRWYSCLKEGDLAGEEETGEEYYFNLGGDAPTDWNVGDRIYIVAYGRVRGYAPLHHVEEDRTGFAFVRRGNAVAVTIAEPIRGFQGFRRRWWQREAELPFPDWQRMGVQDV